MQRLKALRQSHNYTQKQLAQMLKTTQQTVARWEADKAEPSLSALRDLAMIFGTSVDDLLGKNPLSNKVASTMLHLFGRNAVADGFWGHVGVLMHGQTQTKWFPITVGSAEEFSRALKSVERETEWICISTLNNHMVPLNPTKVRRIWLLDDACDDSDDWNDEAIQDYSGNPLEFYRGLDAYFSHDVELQDTSSETYRKIIEEFVKERELDEEKAFRMLHYTTIYVADGTTTSYWADSKYLYNFITDIDFAGTPTIIAIHAEGGDFESYFPIANIAVVEMPLIDVMDVAKTDDAELAGDNEYDSDANSSIDTSPKARE